VNWRPKSKEELGRRATVIIQAFKETAAKDGIYEILVDIFGHVLARQFCRRENCNYPLGLTDGDDNPPSTHIGRATALPPLLNISGPAPHRLHQPTPVQGQFIMTPRGGIRAMEPSFAPLEGQFQVMTPRGIRAIQPNFLSKGPGFPKPSKPASRSVHSQPDSVVTANIGLISTSPRRFTAVEKGKRKESPTPIENGRSHSTRRLI
jgi:hypothetical protein